MRLNKYIGYSLCILILGAVVSCEKMDATHAEYIKGGIIKYAVKPDSLTAHSGNKRMQLSLHFNPDIEPKITKVKLYWNLRGNSAEFPVSPTSGQRRIDIMLNDLPKGSYTFEMYTYDKNDNSSVKMEVSGDVYDDDFANERVLEELSLRQPINLVEDRGILNWFQATYLSGVEVKYTDVFGNSKTERYVGNNLTIAEIPNIKPGSNMQYRALYLPNPTAIDTAYSSFLSGTVPTISQLDKSKFSPYLLNGNRLTGDASIFVLSSAGMLTEERMWDDSYGQFNVYETSTQALPQSFTIDMGVTKKLNSFRYFMRGINGVDEFTYLYNNANPKTWELWGRADEPNPDGSYTGWTKLMTCTAGNKPSGLPAGQINDLDRVTAAAGELYTIPAPFNNMPVKYLRWKTLTNYGNIAAKVTIQELAFYENP